MKNLAMRVRLPERQKGMALPVQIVANRFLEIARLEGKTIDPMKLQKLVYLAHAWNLAFTGQPLIQEQFEAWKFGPVCPPLYRLYKQFGSGPIPAPVNGQSALEHTFEHIIREAWRVYGERTGMNLSDLTHESGSAWSQVFSSRLFNVVIPNDFIQNEFTRRRTA